MSVAGTVNDEGVQTCWPTAASVHDDLFEAKELKIYGKH
jgi:hypothetical protein